MAELRGELDLAQEAVAAERLGEVGAQHLERDVAVVLEVVREVDRGHAAGAELALDAVAALEGGEQLYVHRVPDLAASRARSWGTHPWMTSSCEAPIGLSISRPARRRVAAESTVLGAPCVGDQGCSRMVRSPDHVNARKSPVGSSRPSSSNSRGESAHASSRTAERKHRRCRFPPPALASLPLASEYLTHVCGRPSLTATTFVGFPSLLESPPANVACSSRAI